MKQKTKRKREVTSKKLKKLLIIELCIIFGIVLAYIILKLNIMPECYIHSHFGLLCLSCGGTRMAEDLFAGDIKSAFLVHPVFFIALVYLFAFNIVFIINSLRKNKICKWIYPNLIYLAIFVISLILFTIFRNMI